MFGFVRQPRQLRALGARHPNGRGSVCSQSLAALAMSFTLISMLPFPLVYSTDVLRSEVKAPDEAPDRVPFNELLVRGLLWTSFEKLRADYDQGQSAFMGVVYHAS